MLAHARKFSKSGLFFGMSNLGKPPLSTPKLKAMGKQCGRDFWICTSESVLFLIKKKKKIGLSFIPESCSLEGTASTSLYIISFLSLPTCTQGISDCQF